MCETADTVLLQLLQFLEALPVRVHICSCAHVCLCVYMVVCALQVHVQTCSYMSARPHVHTHTHTHVPQDVEDVRPAITQRFRLKERIEKAGASPEPERGARQLQLLL